jgi:hypothetical protein
MFKTLAIAAFASTMALAAPISSAEAKTNINLDFGINLGGGYYGEPSYYPAYEPAPVYVDYCGAARQAVRYQGFKKVQVRDCSGPTFGFKAKRNGNWYYVRTNVHGNIKTVELL